MGYSRNLPQRNAQAAQVVWLTVSLQALAILSVRSPSWVLCDLSQNLHRMPILKSFDDPFMCITHLP